MTFLFLVHALKLNLPLSSSIADATDDIDVPHRTSSFLFSVSSSSLPFLTSLFLLSSFCFVKRINLIAASDSAKKKMAMNNARFPTIGQGSRNSPSPSAPGNREVSPHRAYYFPQVDRSGDRLSKIDFNRIASSNTLSSFSPSPCRYSSSEREMTPTGFNHPRTIMTPIRTVRRMFHYADDNAKRSFYSAFLEVPKAS